MHWCAAERGGNFEFILVDDGSKDNTHELLYEIQSKYPDAIKVVSKPNGGVSSARNAGIEVASNEWIGFLDSDDVFAPGSLSYLTSFLDDSIDILEFDAKILPQCPSDYPPLSGEILKEDNARIYYNTINTIVVWKILIRKSYVKEHNLHFRDLKIGEDGLFIFDACMAGGRIRKCSTIATYHIDRDDSLTTSIDSKYVRTIISSVMYAQEYFCNFIEENNPSPELLTKIRGNQRRQITFVHTKIRQTNDFSVKEIKETCNKFKEYGAFPILEPSRSEMLINYLYQHPRQFIWFSRIYRFLKRIK